MNKKDLQTVINSLDYIANKAMEADDIKHIMHVLVIVSFLEALLPPQVGKN